MNIYKSCNLCHRNCQVNRYEKRGICGASNNIEIARASLHMWEEPPITGEFGSGTIFFSHCNLKCIFCQNRKISTQGFGKKITIDKFSDICLELQNKKATNINLVTPTHYIPSIIKGINKARKKGLTIPIVYNTSSYETEQAIDMLDGIVDIYLADLKYYSDEYAIKYSHAKNYFEVATKAISKMYEQVGKPVFKDGIMTRGIIVRILVLPGLKEDVKKILDYLYSTYHDDIYISIMSQYTPIRQFKKYTNLNNRLTDEEYDEIVEYAMDIGIKNAFIQEGEAAEESFIPDFDLSGI